MTWNEKLLAAVDKAVMVSSVEVERFINAARRQKPDMEPEELILYLERSFTGLVAGGGALAGGVAAAPGVGFAPGVVAGVADAAAFTAAAGVYVLAVAEVHGLSVEDVERRKALLLGVLIGSAAPAAVERAAGRVGAHWGRHVVQAIPMPAIRQVNRVLGRNFVTKYGTKQGILVLGKSVPFGFGAVIGAGGNAAFARLAIKAARNAFGPVVHEELERI